MRIDRDQVTEAFAKYTAEYDSSDEKIRLKIEHTYRVAVLCEEIAQSLDLSEDDVDLAWLLGMLHDIGRFEQLRQYGTFEDAKSIDHATFGADLLFGRSDTKQCFIRDFLMDVSENALIETAIRSHSLYRIPEGLEERTIRYCHILRDADKIDILKVNVEVPLEEIYNVTTVELRESVVTDAVMQGYLEHHAILRAIKKTPVDNIVGHLALVYELVYPISIRIVCSQGYLKQLMQFASDNPKTREQFVCIRKEMQEYLHKILNTD